MKALFKRDMVNKKLLVSCRASRSFLFVKSLNKMIGKKKRFDVLTRDGFACQYCGKKPPYTILEVDHKISKSNGGSDEMNNLTTACFECNRGKGSDNIGDSKENKGKLYKRKMDDICYELKQYFYNKWNLAKMGTLGKNELILLNFLVNFMVKGDDGKKYCAYLDNIITNPARTKLNNSDYEELDNVFKQGGDFCDKVLQILFIEGKESIDIIIEEVYEDSNWSWDTRKGIDYSGKLNYELTTWTAELGYVVKKYSLFPHLLEDGKN